MSGCVVPYLKLEHQAQRLGFQSGLVNGKGFRHRIFIKGAPCANGRLHVYVEGDGLAWLPGNRAALDPTPPSSCLLPLMAKDPAPSVYLGRPCYHGLARSKGCHPRLWTQERYGETVVDSLALALERIIGGPSCRVVLIGYSGGGTLAMLLASRLVYVVGVVTLAGNLDPDGWTRLHGYSLLKESLNPARLPPLPQRIFQIHVTGERDDNIPVTLIVREAGRQPDARLLILPDQTHRCPPDDVWEGILTAIDIFESDRQKTASRCVHKGKCQAP